MTLLLDRGAEVDKANKVRSTFFLVYVCPSVSANLCLCDAQEGCTPLMWCSQEGLTMAVMLLLERGADPKRQLHVVSIV